MRITDRRPTRRTVLAGAGAAGGLGAVPLIAVRPAAATPEKMKSAIKTWSAKRRWATAG